MALLPDSLKALLDQGGRDAVERLLIERPDLSDAQPKNLQELCVRAAWGPSLMTCFAGLDEFHVAVLHALVACPDPITLDAVRTLLPGAEREDVARVLARFEVVGLAALRTEDVWVLPQVRSMRLPGFGPRASNLLEGMTVDHLGRIVSRLAASAGSKRKADLLVAAAGALRDPHTVRRVITQGPGGTTELATMLLRNPMTSAPRAYYGPPKEVSTPLDWLLAHGLVLAVPNQWGVAVMPLDVAIALNGGSLFTEPVAPHPPPLLAEPVTDPRSEASCIARALALVTHVTELCEELARHPAAMLASGGMGVRELRKLAKALSAEEHVLARHLELAAAAGLVGLGGGRSAYAPTIAYDEWAASPIAQRWGALVAAWIELGHHPRRETNADGKPQPLLLSARDQKALIQRRSVLSALAEAGGRVNPHQLLARLAYVRPMVWAGPGDEPGLEQLLAEVEDLGLGSGPWLGPLGVPVAADEHDIAIKLLDEQAPEMSAEFVISGDLTVLAATELYPSVAAELELLADRVSGGMAKVYRLSESSLRRGFDAGRSAEELLAFLSTHAPRGIPQALDYLVRDIGRRYGRLRVGALGSYCRYDEDTLAPLLIGDRRSAALKLRVLAPGLLGADAPPEQLVAQLRAAGYLPVAEDAAGEAVPQVVPAVRAAPARRPDVRGAARDLPALADRIWTGKQSPEPTPFELFGTWCSSCQAYHPDDEIPYDLPRPVQVASGSWEVTELLGVAFEQGFGIELTWQTGGRRRVADVWIDSLSQQKVRVDLADGSTQIVAISSIETVRVLTKEQEDDMSRGV